MLKDDIMAVKKQLKEVQEQSFAMELLKDARKTNKRQFIIILVMLAMFTLLLGYTLWLLNDIGVVEETTATETFDVDQESGDNSNNNFINGNNNEVNN